MVITGRLPLSRLERTQSLKQSLTALTVMTFNVGFHVICEDKLSKHRCLGVSDKEWESLSLYIIENSSLLLPIISTYVSFERVTNKNDKVICQVL